MSVLRQNDGSFYLSGLVLADAVNDCDTARIVCFELLRTIIGGTVLPGMVALQFAPTPFDFNCSPDTCPHKELEEGEYGVAVCRVCRKRFDWFCPKSPDQQCHYHMDGLKPSLLDPEQKVWALELRDGSLVEFAQHPHEDEYESEDECLFCGCPEERK